MSAWRILATGSLALSAMGALLGMAGVGYSLTHQTSRFSSGADAWFLGLFFSALLAVYGLISGLGLALTLHHHRAGLVLLGMPVLFALWVFTQGKFEIASTLPFLVKIVLDVVIGIAVWHASHHSS